VARAEQTELTLECEFVFKPTISGEDNIKFRRVSIEEVFFQAQIGSYKEISAL